MFLVKKLILPLAGGIRGFGVDLAVDERDQLGRGETLGNVRDTEIGDRLAALRMVAGEAPGHRAAPVVADPDGTLAAEMGQQLEHVINAVFERVVGVGLVVRGAPVTAQVRGDAAEPEGGKTAELVSPATRQLRPAVDEDDQGPA
jgi:hypothetical protein